MVQRRPELWDVASGHPGEELSRAQRKVCGLVPLQLPAALVPPGRAHAQGKQQVGRTLPSFPTLDPVYLVLSPLLGLRCVTSLCFPLSYPVGPELCLVSTTPASGGTEAVA